LANLQRRDDRIQRICAGDKNINIVIVEKSEQVAAFGLEETYTSKEVR